MRGELSLHVIHISGTRMIEEGIDGLSIGNNLGGIVRGLNPLQFVLLYQGAVVRLSRLESWIRTSWGKSFISLSAKDVLNIKGVILYGIPLRIKQRQHWSYYCIQGFRNRTSHHLWWFLG